ncbi:MAG TPA: ABC transporter permease, partial [Clostridiales bacterium]|nr:ABC transporter permease [Clostridiales bacterium]
MNSTKNLSTNSLLKNKKFLQYFYNILSFTIFVAIWIFISSTKAGKIFASPMKVLSIFYDKASDGSIWVHIFSSLYRAVSGFLLAFVCALPVSFLMGWYRPFRSIVEPWVKFIKSIPPIAYIPLIIVAQGIGESAKVTVIFIAAFLVMVISVYQGVIGVDYTLIKAGRVLGSNELQTFIKIVIPSSLPHILVGVRLGLAASLTTLVAAELTGAQVGLGQMIQEASMYFQMDVVLMGILIIGIIGFIFDRLVAFLERRLTGWQETRKT